MRCYLIQDNRITVCAAAPKTVGPEFILLQSIKNLDSRRFPLPRLVAIWNALPGVEPVNRFRDRPGALKRIWAALEALPISSTRTDSKQARLIGMLQRPAGATMDQLMSATGWQSHSVRGVLSGVLRKKLGLNVASEVQGDRRVYRIAP